MQKMLLGLLLLGLGAIRLPAQCMVVANCPVADTVCDPAFNSAQFWNESYWYDPLYNSHDLAEGSVDLPLYVLDSCGMANVSISYVLFLDLNNDGLRETAVTSNNLPPANTVYFGNATNPGYTGGTPRNFDERLVSTAQKYRFGLMQSLHEDTLIARVRWLNSAASPDTLNPRLPAGTHRIEWRVQQGSTVRTCQYDFTVRDCYPPLLSCQPGAHVFLDASGLFQLSLPALLNSAGDNYTPGNQLQFSLREADSGTGFPLDSAGNVVQQLNFNCTQLGFHLLEVWAKDKAGLSSRCQTYLVLEDTAFVCSPPPPVLTEVCVKHFCNGQGVEGVGFGWQGGDPADAPQPLFGIGLTGVTGCLLMAIPAPPAATGLFYAQKDDNPLNGVSTFDLVLMSRHLLGLQPLGSPYKMIAADVNHSNSITTFDIVELRKLILGIYQTLPNNTSWRFVDAAFVFPNPNNAFETAFPEGVSLPNLAASTAPADFFALKVGDVNCSALNALASPEDRHGAQLVVADLTLAAGAEIAVPIQLAEAAAWLGGQGSLVFDAEKLTVKAITAPKLTGWSDDDWARSPAGVNWSWSAAKPVVLLPGDELLTLQIKALAPLQLRDVLTLGDPAGPTARILPPEAYTEAGSRVTLSLQFWAFTNVLAGETQIYLPRPNPTFASLSIPLHLDRNETVSLEITDLTGRIVFRLVTVLDRGAQLLEVPATAFPQAGVYGWRVQAGPNVGRGKVVRL